MKEPNLSFCVSGLARFFPEVGGEKEFFFT